MNNATTKTCECGKPSVVRKEPVPSKLLGEFEDGSEYFCAGCFLLFFGVHHERALRRDIKLHRS